MKVVLDTNVWVSALAFPGGTCDQLLQYFIRHPAIEIIASPFILHEFERVLLEKIGLSSHETGLALWTLRTVTTSVEPKERIGVVKEKDSDNRILECAVAAEADLLVTGDTKHLLPIKIFREIPIRSPREVFDRLQSL